MPAPRTGLTVMETILLFIVPHPELVTERLYQLTEVSDWGEKVDEDAPGISFQVELSAELCH